MEKNIFEKYKTFVMVGKSGCGKGMQAKMLFEKSGFKIFSTGDKLRALQKEDTALGKRVAETINKGEFVPDWLATFLFEEAVMYLSKEEGVIYEGAARKAAEAEFFHKVMTYLERPYKAVYLEAPDDEVTKRLLKRKETEGRADDHEEAIKMRLEEYQKWVVPAIEVFKREGTLLVVNGHQSPEEVHNEILAKLAEETT
jgi:adenylate kinase